MTTGDVPFGSSCRKLSLVVVAGFAAVWTLTACSSGSKSATTPQPTAPVTAAAPPASTTTAPVATTVTSLPPGGSASPTAPEALSSALTSVYTSETGTLATYRRVVATLGSVGPFPNVISSEEQHVAAITALLNNHAVAVPPAAAGQPSPATFSAACALGVTSEQQIISLYTVQLPTVTAYPDVTTVFQNLLAASRDNHLPAFQHCA